VRSICPCDTCPSSLRSRVSGHTSSAFYLHPIVQFSFTCCTLRRSGRDTLPVVRFDRDASRTSDSRVFAYGSASTLPGRSTCRAPSAQPSFLHVPQSDHGEPFNAIPWLGPFSRLYGHFTAAAFAAGWLTSQKQDIARLRHIDARVLSPTCRLYVRDTRLLACRDTSRLLGTSDNGLTSAATSSLH
jgi:hypothetical protein